MKKNLIVYASRTGNTEKIANELAKNFTRHGWENVLKKLPDKYDAKNPDFSFDDYDFACVGSPVISELPVDQIRTVTYGSPGLKKLSPGPKCGIVFCTYGGIHLGPPEAVPALKLMEVELMHQCFNVIGSLAIPGSMGNRDLPEVYYADLKERPNAQDMQNVATFVDSIMTKLKDYPYYQAMAS
jgi:flavorubredoxin